MAVGDLGHIIVRVVLVVVIVFSRIGRVSEMGCDERHREMAAKILTRWRCIRPIVAHQLVCTGGCSNKTMRLECQCGSVCSKWIC